MECTPAAPDHGLNIDVVVRRHSYLPLLALYHGKKGIHSQVRALIQRIREAVRRDGYRLTAHAESEREADIISVQEIEEAFGSESIELLEEYPDDPRGSSTLLLGFTKAESPLHAVIGLSSPDVIVFITLYRPDPDLWYDWRRRV